MAAQERLEVAFGALSLVTTILLSARSVHSLSSTLVRRRQNYRELDADSLCKDVLYKDKDGEASEESQAEFSNQSQKCLILTAAVTAAALAVVVAVFEILNWSSHALRVVSQAFFIGNWGFIVLQGLDAFCEKHCTKVWDAGVRIAASTVIVTSWFIYAEVWGRPISYFFRSPLGMVVLAELLFASLLVTVSILVPRRPRLFKDGKPIDDMFTGTLFSKLTFSWANPLLTRAYQLGRLDVEDIPAVPSLTRAADLDREFHAYKTGLPLYLKITMLRLRHYLLQTGTACIEAAGGFAPQFFMFKIIRSLETRDNDTEIQLGIFIWVIGLGVAKVGIALVQQFSFWICYYGLYCPIRAQIATVIFKKTLMKKDVKGTAKNPTAKAQDSGKKDINGKEDEEKDELKGTRQGVINLISVDGERVAEFFQYSFLLPESVVGLVIGFTFIFIILGWESVVAGFAAVLLTTPVNIYFSKQYVRSQDELMKARDRKLAVVTEALQGIRQIKFNALEKRWEERIDALRQGELKVLYKVFVSDTLLIACWISGPILFSVIALGTHAYLKGELTASQAFTALGVFNELELYLSIIPEMITHFLDAYVSSKRLEKYLNSPEKVSTAISSERIAFENADICWPFDEEEQSASQEDPERFTLHNVSLEFPRGELSIISGKTGSGKSLLLSALIGEAEILSGNIYMPEAPGRKDRHDEMATPANWVIQNAVAYVAQIPWIENASIKDNILFGLPFEERRYRATIKACALDKDLEMLSDGDLTEIGANGINVSGGQRWRISFARALYSRAGILILDDVFSAVDAHVGKHLFDYALTGELSVGRTRILVTHHLKLVLSKTKYSVFLGEGRVLKAGSVDELSSEGALQDVIAAVDEQEEDDISKAPAATTAATNGEEKKAAAFIQEEGRETGAVKLSVYLNYIKAAGGIWVWIGIISIFLLNEVLLLGRSWIVKLWTQQNQSESGIATHWRVQHYNYAVERFTTIARNDPDLVFWMGLYASVSFIFIIIATLKYFVVYCSALVAARKLFRQMLGKVLRAPSRWLDTVPRGRIINRFTKDFEKLDALIAADLAFMIYNGFGLLGVFIAATAISPVLLTLAAVMCVASVLSAIYYLAGGREVKRIESNVRSPIFEHYESTLAGVSTVRAYNKVSEYLEEMYKRVDTYTKMTYYLWLLNRWIGLRLQIFGAVYAGLVAAAVVLLPSVGPSAAGFALSYALTFSMNLIWAVRRYSSTELNMNSTERILEYCNLPVEESPDQPAPHNWPSKGHLKVENLVVSYAPELPPVLKGISFEALPGERVAIVGRTGAGKSSFSLALFRFIIASEGRIVIDDVDISTISVYDLRRRISIIPQDPVLFSGTVRSNLDPFTEHSDQLLYDALRRVHLIPPLSLTVEDENPASESGSSTPTRRTATNPFTNLNSPVSEGGLNLSQGQRQLLCLARALILKPRLLLLDEATSSIDVATEDAIRTSLNEEFKNTTTIVIAHRLSGVMDADRIVVMGSGQVLEVGAPGDLMTRESVFRGMVEKMEGAGSSGGTPGSAAA